MSTPASTPAIGQTVHYTARGSADGVYQPVCRAALITETDPTATDQRIGLAVINPSGIFFHALAADDDRDHRGGCAYDPDRRPGSWHWPADCHDTYTAPRQAGEHA